MARERIGLSGESGTSSRFPTAVNETLTGNRVITLAELDRTQAFAFDPGGAGRNVTLPPVGDCKGTLVFIANTADAAEILTIKNSAAATILTPTQGESAFLWCDGAAWYGIAGANS